MILRRAHVLLVALVPLILCGFCGIHVATAASLTDIAQLQASFLNIDTLSTPGTDPATAAASKTVTVGPFTESASASGSATFGTVKGLASASASHNGPCGGPCDQVTARSQGAFTDTLSIIGGGGLSFVAATGTSSGTGTAELVLTLISLTSATGGQCEAFNSGSCTTPLAQIKSGPNTLSLQEDFIVTATANLGSGGGSVLATSDFSHSGILSTIHGFDINGNELTDLTVTSESGFDYPTGPLNATPEPATLVLCGTTLAAGLGWTGRRRR